MSEFVINPFTEEAYFDFDDFSIAIDQGIRALDEIIDENQDNHALEEQKQMSLKYRNVGLGIMGMWDMLCKLGIKYGSKESKEYIDSIMGFMFRRAVIASSILAKEKGAFPGYTSNVLKSRIIKDHFSDTDIQKLEIDKYGLRNCSLLSIAPTGSIGTMFNISTGCEPAFQISYKRKTESLNGKDTYYDVYIGIAQEYIDKFQTDKLPEYFVPSSDINWKDRIELQSILQDHVDTAISSTVNLPNKISKEEIEELYLYAWKLGLKGVTIFRDGCKRAGILSTCAPDSSQKEPVKELKRGMIIKADDNCVGKKRTLYTGCGTLHCQAFFDPDTGELLETYFSKGSSGGCNNFMIGLSRLISLAARGGVDVYSIVDQLKSSGTCPSYAVRTATNHITSKGASCPVAIGNALIEMYKEFQEEIGTCDEEKEKPKVVSKTITQGKCPECGESVRFEGGCITCMNCGWTKCD